MVSSILTIALRVSPGLGASRAAPANAELLDASAMQVLSDVNSVTHFVAAARQESSRGGVRFGRGGDALMVVWQFMQSKRSK